MIYTSGMTNTAEFMGSGWPYALQVSNSQVVQFPWVTSEIYVCTAGSAAAIGFSAGITGSNKIIVPANTNMTFRVKVKTLYTSGSFSLGAALTNIVPAQYPTLVSGTTVVYQSSTDDTNTKIYPGV